jgi:hypothetical protein
MNAPDVRRLLWARGLRAFGDGYVSLLLPLYLIALGLSPFEVGVIATGTLVGSGLLTLLVGLHAYRLRYRTLLLMATGLMTATGFGFAVVSDFWPLLIIAIVGTLNPSSGDVSVFLPLEQAVLARSVSDKRRTAVFARYSLVGALVGAAGSLFAGFPELLASALHLADKSAWQLMFVLYGLLGFASGMIYRKLPGTLAFSSGLASCRPFPIWSRCGCPTGSVSSTRWCSRICRRTYCCWSFLSSRACRGSSGSCSCAQPCPRWTCPPAIRT